MMQSAKLFESKAAFSTTGTRGLSETVAADLIEDVIAALRHVSA
jgi:hypothetical protein